MSLIIRVGSAALSCLFVFASVANAKVFRNSYVSFELPPRWDCSLDKTEWICRSSFEGRDRAEGVRLAKEAIIILTAKEIGPSDSLADYERHLKTPKMVSGLGGATIQSQIVKVENRNIANHTWVDGLHLSSEIPNYYTRYLATVKDRIAILVTFSAHKSVYTRYSSDFFRSILSLRVVTSRELIGQNGVRPGQETLGVNIQSQLPQDMMGGEEYPEEGGGSGSVTVNQMILGVAFLLALAGIYLLLKMNKKPRRRK